MNLFKLPFLTALLIILTSSFVLAEAIKISIPEMECESCSKAIEAKLKQEKDITKISIDLKERVVTVFTVDSVKMSDERINALIKDSGFEAKSIERAN